MSHRLVLGLGLLGAAAGCWLLLYHECASGGAMGSQFKECSCSASSVKISITPRLMDRYALFAMVGSPRAPVIGTVVDTRSHAIKSGSNTDGQQ